MKKSTETISSKDNLLADDETWLAILEPELCKDSAAVECLARLLFIIKKEINSAAGVRRANEILSNGIDVMYLYTNAHKAAIELYVLYLEGDLPSKDEPLNLINAAIERGKSRTR